MRASSGENPLQPLADFSSALPCPVFASLPQCPRCDAEEAALEKTGTQLTPPEYTHACGGAVVPLRSGAAPAAATASSDDGAGGFGVVIKNPGVDQRYAWEMLRKPGDDSEEEEAGAAGGGGGGKGGRAGAGAGGGAIFGGFGGGSAAPEGVEACWCTVCRREAFMLPTLG